MGANIQMEGSSFWIFFRRSDDRASHSVRALFASRTINRHDPQTIEDFGCHCMESASDILKIYMWVGDFNVLIQLQIKSITHEKKTPFPEYYFFIFGRKKRLAR